tara:strand:+ start:71 stop:529 length:459 start_codon:yes stop_codon:yes gene_type:complete
MKIIAHRANINGPNSLNENKISGIKKCIDMGFDIEIDIRFLDGRLYLGHDNPEEIITIKELKIFQNSLWIHCKNLRAISFFKQVEEDFNYFWHDKDSYTLTSKGDIWAYPGEELSSECICVMPERDFPLNEIKHLKNKKIAGICTDYPILLN